MRRLGRKHGQESVITKDKDKPARLHDTQNKKPNKSANLGKSNPGKNPKGEGETSGTKIRSGKLQKQTKKKRITTIKNAIEDLQKNMMKDVVTTVFKAKQQNHLGIFAYK